MPGVAAAERAIHVVVGPTLVASNASLVEVTHNLKGVLLDAQVTFDPEVDFKHGDYLHAAGQLLGFQRTAGVDTVVNAIRLNEAKALTAADLQSVAAVYPACR